MNTSRRSVVGPRAVRLRIAMIAGVGAAMVICPRAAQASGFASQRFGGEEGSVVATNPTAVYFNPGAMGFSGAGALGLYGTLAIRHATWTHAATSNPGDAPYSQLGNSGEAHLLNVFGGPAVGGTVRLGRLVLGGGFFAPFYGRAHWDKNDALSPADRSKYPLAIDGVQRWFGIDAELSILYFSAGAAYRIGPLSIGATGNVIYSTVVTTQAKNPTGQGLPDTSNEGRASLDVSGVNASFAIGAMLEVLPERLWLAASYQARPGLGAQTLTGTLDLASKFGPSHYDVGFTQALPDVYRAGVRWRPTGVPVEIRFFGDLTRWSAMTSQCVSIDKPISYECVVNTDGSDASGGPGGVQANFRRTWKDTYGARIGVSYWVKPRVELLAGTGYETAAVPDATMTPDLPDAQNIAATLGARLRLTDALFLSASYTHLQYIDRDNTGKSALAAVQGQPVSVPTAQEDGGGKYTQWIGMFNGNVEALFP
jgi:long-chain fatty acid transport protein